MSLFMLLTTRPRRHLRLRQQLLRRRIRTFFSSTQTDVEQKRTEPVFSDEKADGWE